MTDLEKFQLVNQCETIEGLEHAILLFARKDGTIQGRDRSFNAFTMSACVAGVVNNGHHPNLLTREFGIRQQALYLRFYNKT